MFTRWSAKNGYREALHLGMPLVVSMMSATVMTFTDRIFLGNYSMEALGASLPASIASFLFLSFFIGVVEYVSVFVSQYTGACRPDKVGAALWQGLWFCVPAGVFLVSLCLIAEPLFRLGGHPPEVQQLEIVYFRILTVGSVFHLIGITLCCFYSGRKLTKPVMVVNAAAATVNIPLDYCLINGIGPFPELGIVGAGIATVFGFALPAVVFGLMVFTRENEERFQVRSSYRIQPRLFSRFMRFGLPGGVQFFLDMFGVSFFVFMVGRIGEVELAASNIAISIDTLAFLPTIGMSIAASIMVGQEMGAGRPDQAAYATKSVLHLALLYMGGMGVLFVLFPGPLIELFRTREEVGVEFATVMEMGRVLMLYVAAFTVVDAVAITYIGALKGAGDTRFIMATMGIASFACLVVPISLMSWMDRLTVHGPWACLLAYVCVLATTFMIRFRKGPWRTIEVIDRSEA